MIRKHVTALVLVAVSVALSACLSPSLPTRTAQPSSTPLAKAGTVAASPTANPPSTPLAKGGTTATPKPSPTPATNAAGPQAATLALPAEFADGHAAVLAQVQQSQPSLRIERVSDSAAALARLQGRQAHWAISVGSQPSASAQLLCLTPYVPIVHFSSPLEDLSADRVREIMQGKDWTGGVYYSGDAAILRRVLNVASFGANVVALPSWQAVIERVAGDRTAFAFVPWSVVDARVKTLALGGRSIAANGLDAAKGGYSVGDAWWLSTASGAPAAGGEIARTLACPLKEPVTFLAAGDMLMGWYVNDVYIKKEGPEYLFRRIADLTRSADIAFGNFENPMTNRGESVTWCCKFRASPDAVKGLTYAGIDVVNLANNHMGDYGADAVADTLKTLEQNGIGYIGAGRDRNAARSPWITTTQGVKIAILGYNEIGASAYAATNQQAGTAWIEMDNVVAEIKRAKSQADFVIVSFHWGSEFTVHANKSQQDMARRAAEAGADLIVGHHPHVVQGVGFFNDVFVNYSIGDFVYSQPTRPATGEGIILRAVIEGSALKQVQMIPIYIDRAQPYVISPVEAKLMMARIFDATSAYKGLPPSSETAAPAPAAQALPAATAAAPAGSLAFVQLTGDKADIVLGSGAPSSVARSLTTSGALNDAPAWSPDGKRLAYSSARDGTVDIFVAAADGAGAVNLTRHAAWDDYPAWSPDGAKIAFSSNREGSYKIYVMNADGSGLRRLTSGAAWDTTPAWSPDGKRIAFASDRSETFQIYTMNVDGGDLRQMTKQPRLCAFPSWSPDGASIVYQSYEDESFTRDDDSVQDRDYEIMLVSAGGGASRRLTNNVYADIQPVWSRDGRRIAFASDRSGNYQVYVMNADGGEVTAVTSGATAHLSPAWAP
jgi:Tol biopolymer transport system component